MTETSKAPIIQNNETDSIKPRTFEEQFNTVNQVTMPNGEVVNYFDIIPQRTPENHELTDPTPIILSPGWGAGHKAYKSVAKECFMAGREVILTDPIENTMAKESSHNVTTMSNRLPNVQRLIAVLEHNRTSKDDPNLKTDVIAHSQGSIYAVLAALERPDLVRSIVFTGPVGMIGDDSFWKIIGRFLPVVGRSLTRDLLSNPASGFATNMSLTKHVVKHPKRAIKEIHEMAEFRMDDLLYDLRLLGVKVGILQWAADSVFPHQRIEEKVAIEGIVRRVDGEYDLEPGSDFGNVDIWASAANRKAGHGDLQIHPRRSARAALTMLTQLRN